MEDSEGRIPGGVCVHELFELQAGRTPDASAVLCNHDRLTYRELNQRANQLAAVLRQLGVARGTIVGVCLERSLDAVVALLGVLKSGGAYLPLDPGYPPARLAFMLANSRADIVVTETRSARDGRFVEVLGHYNPRLKPEKMEVDRDRLAHWLKAGARPSDSVRTLVDRLPPAPPAAEGQAAS